MLGDAQSTPQAGTAEIEKMNEAGCAAVVGAYASAICLATTQAAAKYNLPHVVDVGVADQIVERGLKNTFRFGPGYKVCAQIAMSNLHVLNTAAGKPAKSVMIIHEESLFGTGTANLLAKELPGFGYEVKEVIKHANPTRDFNNIVLRMKAVNPDIVIPANYYNEYALLVRTMQQQKVSPKAIYSVLGGAASSYKFVKEFPDAANGIIDCNHWFNPKDKRALELKKRTEAKNLFYSYEVFNTYTAVRLLADAIERAKSADRAAITDALASSTFSDHFMPYGPTRFENGQNTGRAAADDAGDQRRHPRDRAARLSRGRAGVSVAQLRLVVPSCLERRGGRCPVWAHDVAAGPAGRLRCGARHEAARRNSLRSLRSLHSDNRRESDVEARAARARASCLRSSPRHKSPTPGTAHRAAPFAVFRHAYHHRAGKAVGGCAPAATYAAPSSAERMAARAQRALQLLTRRDCSSATTAGSEASFSAGHAIEQRREPLAQRGAAASERRRTRARGFAALNLGTAQAT